jgi:oxalate decarboxylase/phosphoglucose isomerase-like protein (cupin superfamily)
MKPTPFDTVSQVIHQTVRLEPSVTLTEQSELYTLGIDSLLTINVLLTLAQTYEVELEQFADRITTLATVGDLCALAAEFAAAAPYAAAAQPTTPLIKYFARQTLTYEYGLDGIRTFPWEGVNTPIGSGYCIVRPASETLSHINDPADEDELFIGIRGQATVLLDGHAYPFGEGDQVFIPRGMVHSVRNDSDQPFHFFTVWWNRAGAQAYLSQEPAQQPAQQHSQEQVGA